MKKLIRLDRLRWLLFLRMYSSGKAKNLSSQYRMPSFGNIKQSDIRNVGIIAHIDAGKTTVTERALFLAGVTKFIGDVDSGNTVTDFMELERERGITIQSAAVSLMWGGKQINLIDTPGHVDFTLEVERCIRVLDGAIVILDASAGVQAQTITVWRQAQKFSLPSVVFINKMDKTGADFEKSVESLTSRLGVGSPIPICLPTYSSDGQLTGIIDLLHHCFLDINQKNSAKWNKLTETSKNFNELMSGREELLSKIADIDDAFAELLLSEPTAATESSSMDSEVLSAIKRLTKARKMVPVVCGSALRVTTSVVPLLDMCAELLPAPNERNQAIPTIFGNKFCSLVFKVTHDQQHGQLSFIRVYSGRLKDGATVFNATRQLEENRLKLYIPQGDELQAVGHVTAGNIAVVSGMQSTFTGDTLVENVKAARNAVQRYLNMSSEDSEFVNDLPANETVLLSCKVTDDVNSEASSLLLESIDYPDPVYFCCVEPPSSTSQNDFERALKELGQEDPSLRIRIDKTFGQTVIEGMGELHIEVIKARLQRDYGLNVFMGPLQVEYREVITEKVLHSATLETSRDEQMPSNACTVTLEVKPSIEIIKFRKVELDLSESILTTVRSDWLKAINEGCLNALHNGPVLGFPVNNVSVILKDLVFMGGKSSPAIISATTNKCLKEALKKAGPHLIEPIMNVEVTLVNNNASCSSVLHEVGRRRGRIISVDSDVESKLGATVITARIPLSELAGISTTIRTLTSGLGTIHMQVVGYEDVSVRDQVSIVRRYGRSLPPSQY